MTPFAGVDVTSMSHGALTLEQTFYAHQVGYHDTELETARIGLALVEAELARREKEKAA